MQSCQDINKGMVAMILKGDKHELVNVKQSMSARHEKLIKEIEVLLNRYKKYYKNADGNEEIRSSSTSSIQTDSSYVDEDDKDSDGIYVARLGDADKNAMMMRNIRKLNYFKDKYTIHMKHMEQFDKTKHGEYHRMISWYGGKDSSQTFFDRHPDRPRLKTPFQTFSFDKFEPAIMSF